MTCINVLHKKYKILIQINEKLFNHLITIINGNLDVLAFGKLLLFINIIKYKIMIKFRIITINCIQLFIF